MPRPSAPLLLAALLLSGCAMLMHPTEDGHSHQVGPPKVDRCAAQPTPQAQADCSELRDETLVFVRKLFVDEQVCIDAVQPLQDDSRSCQVRAFVEGVSPESVQLEVRAAPPESRYHPMEEWWFHEKALVDINLRAKGFSLPSDSLPPPKE